MWACLVWQLNWTAGTLFVELIGFQNSISMSCDQHASPSTLLATHLNGCTAVGVPLARDSRISPWQTSRKYSWKVKNQFNFIPLGIH